MLGRERRGPAGARRQADPRQCSDQLGEALPAIDFGAGSKATYISALYDQACAILDDGSVRCWGWNNAGQLGLGDKRTRGDGPGEMGRALPVVELAAGRKALQLGAGWNPSCALLEGGTFKCWGLDWAGHVGVGDTRSRGDERGTMGDALPEAKLTGG